MPYSEQWMNSLTFFLSLSIGIGIVDDLGFTFNLGLLSSVGLLWMSTAALLWAGTLFFAIQCIHWRGLWLLIGLPLVLLPFLGAVIGAGEI